MNPDDEKIMLDDTPESHALLDALVEAEDELAAQVAEKKK